MPLVRFDIIEGRSAAQVKALLNAAHSALVAAFRIPERDRYQIVHEHAASHLVMEDTGLGIPRTQDRILIQVTTRPRSRRSKKSSTTCFAKVSPKSAALRRQASLCRW